MLSNPSRRQMSTFMLTSLNTVASNLPMVAVDMGGRRLPVVPLFGGGTIAMCVSLRNAHCSSVFLSA